MSREVLWAAGGITVGGYVLLFLFARRPVTLRLARVGWLLAILVGLRLVLAILAGEPFQGPPEIILTALLGVASLALLLSRRVWLVRATEKELREQIETVCRGLFLEVQELRPGRLQLSARGQPALRLRKLLSRVQVLVLCRVHGPGKVALLCSWLSKNYPGPVPRIRIVLNRR